MRVFSWKGVEFMNKNMQQGKISGPQMYQDGAVYSGWEKFRMSFMGSSNPKEITGRVVIIALVIVLAVFIIASILAGKEPKPFPYSAELQNAIGQKIEIAAQIVGVDSTDLTEIEPGVYSTNCGFPVGSVAYDLHFYTSSGMLSGFAYVAEYQAQPKEAAKEIYDAFINMNANMRGISVKSLKEELDKEIPYQYAQTTEIIPSDENAQKFEGGEDWEYRVDEYVTREAMLYVDRSVSYDPTTQKVHLVYSYKIEPKRETK